ncbi:MAG: hypothetical protein RLZ55_575 [Actinomycetota bacterium]
MDCGGCDGRPFLVSIPSADQTRHAASEGNAMALADLAAMDRKAAFFAERELTLLTDSGKLPDLDGDHLDFSLTCWDDGQRWHVLTVGDGPPQDLNDPRIIHAELAAYETIEPVERIVALLENKYGARFRYLSTRGSDVWLLGDDIGYSELTQTLGAHAAPDRR